jgi:DNA processing protein
MGVAESPADWLRLTLIPGIGGETQRKLLTAFGLPDGDLLCWPQALALSSATKPRDSCSTPTITPPSSKRLPGRKHPASTWSVWPTPSIPRLCCRFPTHRRCSTSAAASICSTRRLWRSSVAATPRHKVARNAERFAAALAEAGLTITSGLALGIDAAAHRGAAECRSGNTVAFIGTGIDRIYPAANRQLAIEIAPKAAIISEFPLGTPPVAANFPRRNRLIAGFSLGALVVEATVDSGSLITARLASEQGREVFAIPGSIHSPQSRGCHKLIKQGAKLVETVQDVLDELHWKSAPAEFPLQSESAQDIPGLLHSMGFDPCSVDELAHLNGLTAGIVSVMLLHLELDGQVASLPGGRYQRISQA